MLLTLCDPLLKNPNKFINLIDPTFFTSNEYEIFANDALFGSLQEVKDAQKDMNEEQKVDVSGYGFVTEIFCLTLAAMNTLIVKKKK